MRIGMGSRNKQVSRPFMLKLKSMIRTEVVSEKRKYVSKNRSLMKSVQVAAHGFYEAIYKERNIQRIILTALSMFVVSRVREGMSGSEKHPDPSAARNITL